MCLAAAAATILLAWLIVPALPGQPVARGGGAWPGSWLIADLDGDSYPDIISTRMEGRGAQGYSYRVEFQLSASGRRVSIPVAGQALGLRVDARDVDGDHEPDLIISDAGAARPLGVWINDGAGGFERHEAGTAAGTGWQAPSSVDGSRGPGAPPLLAGGSRRDGPVRLARAPSPVTELLSSPLVGTLVAAPLPAHGRPPRSRAPPALS